MKLLIQSQLLDHRFKTKIKRALTLRYIKTINHYIIITICIHRSHILTDVYFPINISNYLYDIGIRLGISYI